MNCIKKKMSMLIACFVMCFLSVFAYAELPVYAEGETDKNIVLNYPEVTIFTPQTVKLELEGELIKGRKVTLEEFNRIREAYESNPDYAKLAYAEYFFEGFYYLETTFESDNEAVAVSEEGVVSANSEITDTTVANVKVKYVYKSIDVTQEGTLTSIVTYDNGKILGNDIIASGLTSYYLLSTNYTNGEVTWSVDNEKIATVSSDGILTTKAYGTVNLTATVSDGENTNTITKVVRVSDPKFKKTTEALAVGGSFELEITGIYTDSVKTFSSSKKKHVSVTNSGIVCSLKKTSKDVTITAVIDGRKITMTVKITNPKFNYGDASPILLVKGKKAKVTVKGLIDGLSKVKYSSSNVAIAKVTKAGKVKSKKYGSCYIIAEVDHKIVKINCAVGKKKAIKAVKNAYAVYGCPYSQPKRMNAGYYDCSSLAWRSYKKCGIYVGNVKGKWAATAAEECRYLFAKHRRISKKYCKTKKLRPGDLVFYSGWKNGRYRNITHVAIYVGNDTLIEANWPNGVREASYSKNKKYIVGIGRPVK